MRRAPGWVALVAVGGFVFLSVRSLRYQLQGAIVHPWIASQYWLDYRDGLVRRGLVGAVLRFVAGGRPGGGTVTVVALALTILSSLVVLAIATRVARAAKAHRLLLFGALVFSPLTFGLLLRDIGRYDTVVLLCLGFFALAPRPDRWPSPVLAGVVAAVVLVVAGGTEEFSVGFLLPAAFLWSGWRGERLAVVVAPGVAVSMLSIVARPSESLVEDVLHDAIVERVHVTNTPNMNAVVVLRNSLREQIAWVTYHPRWQMIAAYVVFAMAFAVVVLLLHQLLTSSRRLLVLAGWQAAVATVLCVIGVDYRRWWALALLGVLAGVVHLAPAGDGERPAAAIRPMAVALCMLVFVAFQEVPIESFWSPETLRNYFT